MATELPVYPCALWEDCVLENGHTCGCETAESYARLSATMAAIDRALVEMEAAGLIRSVPSTPSQEGG